MEYYKKMCIYICYQLIGHRCNEILVKCQNRCDLFVTSSQSCYPFRLPGVIVMVHWSKQHQRSKTPSQKK